MAFKITTDNYLQVTAFAKGVQNLLAVYLNANVFAITVKIAGIPEPTSTELINAANEASLHNIDVCCELVHLERSQLGALGLAPNDRVQTA